MIPPPGGEGKLGLSRYYKSPSRIFSEKGPQMQIEEMLGRLFAKYGRFPEKQPVGERRIVGNGKSSVAKEGREES